MAVVSFTEFQNYLSGVKMTPVQKLNAEAILDGVQSELETYLNRSVQQRRTTEVLQATHNGYVHVSNTPIIELYGVYSVNPLDGTHSERPLELPYGAWRAGQNMFRISATMPGAGCVLVDYLGGHNGDKIPGLKLAIMRVAAREYVHNHDDGMTIQNSELRPPEDPNPVPKGWGLDELSRFDRFRRRVAL